MIAVTVALLGLLSLDIIPNIHAQDPDQVATIDGALNPDLNGVLKAVEDLKHHVDELKKKIEGKSFVAFSVGLAGGHLGPYATDITLKFQNVQLNEGNAYNTHTGIFTAPVKGIYYFTLSCFKHNNYIMNVDMYKNGVEIATVYDHSAPGGGDTVTNGVTLLVEVGEQVYVNLLKSTHVIGSPRHTTFNGFLLYSM